jgi:hypothetical protein
MKPRFDIGEKVVWAVGESDHTFRLTYTSQPMIVADMYYQHPVPIPKNGVQKKFHDAGFWPLLPPDSAGLIYVLRYWNDNHKETYKFVMRPDLQDVDYNECLIHEKWLWPYEHEVKLLACILWERAGKPEGRDWEFWFAAEAWQQERRIPYTGRK